MPPQYEIYSDFLTTHNLNRNHDFVYKHKNDCTKHVHGTDNEPYITVTFFYIFNIMNV